MAEILIIDDEPGVLGFLREVLEDAGHSVAEAPDGETALRQFMRAPSDLVITDIFMPRMDGIELLGYLRTLSPGVRILAISGGGLFSPAQALKDATHLGADRILQKPFSKEEVLKIVNETLDTG